MTTPWASSESLGDKRKCPLCGGDNQCSGASRAEPHVPCWCTSVAVSKEALAAIPKDRLGICICRACAER
jgi:hypothetical protein